MTPKTTNDTSNTIEHTAYHEAGHAVLHHFLGLCCEEVTIVPNYDMGEAGYAKHGGEFPADEDGEALKDYAPDAFFLRHAIACYAGAEACRRRGEEDWLSGADQDYRNAVDAISRITGDDESKGHLHALAQRRAVVLVEYYWPEIEALADALLESKTVTGEQVRCIVDDSLTARQVKALFW